MSQRRHGGSKTSTDTALPSRFELLRAVRGHSIAAGGGYTACRIAEHAFELAELHAAKLHANGRTADTIVWCELNGRYLYIVERLDNLVAEALPHLTDRDRHEIRTAIVQIAHASVKIHRALRNSGGGNLEVLTLWHRLAELVDHYDTLLAERMSKSYYSPSRPRSMR